LPKVADKEFVPVLRTDSFLREARRQAPRASWMESLSFSAGVRAGGKPMELPVLQVQHINQNRGPTPGNVVVFLIILFGESDEDGARQCFLNIEGCIAAGAFGSEIMTMKIHVWWCKYPPCLRPKVRGAANDDVAGVGHGLIDVLDLKNGKFHRFATGSDAGGKLNSINSPWGLALAPKSFGEHRDELLVGNFGNGTIMAFNGGGASVVCWKTPMTRPYSLTVYGGLRLEMAANGGAANALYFTAGLDGEADGLFGSIVRPGSMN